MRRSPSNSVRTVALAAGFCVLGIVSGCGRASWDLLSDEALAGATARANSGAVNNAGGGGGGTGAVSGKASGGAGGRTDGGGFGGRFSPPPFGGGGAGNQPSCLADAGSPDEEPATCSRSNPFCYPCRCKSDCNFAGDAKTCDPELKRCVQCRNDSHCPMGYSCNPNTYHCDKSCGGKDGCSFDVQHSFCRPDLGVCVSCIDDPDCFGYAHCAANVCVECVDDSQCPSQKCKYGHCIPVVPPSP
jgi:Cys-rich repeat protein